jgi:hypothetical protein
MLKLVDEERDDFAIRSLEECVSVSVNVSCVYRCPSPWDEDKCFRRWDTDDVTLEDDKEGTSA